MAPPGRGIRAPRCPGPTEAESGSAAVRYCAGAVGCLLGLPVVTQLGQMCAVRLCLSGFAGSTQCGQMCAVRLCLSGFAGGVRAPVLAVTVLCCC